MNKHSFPEHTSTKESILNQLKEMRTKDVRWQDGKSFCLVFHGGEDVYEVLKESYNMFMSENALNPAAFPSLKRMENEVVSMVKSLLSDSEESCGIMTSGGTESILMAVKAAREWARVHKPKVKNPEIIAPISVHPACNKACHYFGIKLITVPVDPNNFQANVEEMKKRISPNTIQLFASAPSYPQGAIDPVEDIARLALDNNILCHVDGCIGGLVLGFYRELGIEVPKFDLSVPGVTSMSVDLHKYGYTAKGASVVLYKNRELRKHQFYCTTNWTGGVYISPSCLGTRPGGAIAAAWAVMNYLGLQGYKSIFQVIHDTTQKFVRKINSIEGLYVLGEPKASIVAIGASTCDIYVLADYMTEKGWHFDRNSTPASVHLTIMYAHKDIIDKFFEDILECKEKAEAEYTPLSNAKKGLVNSMIRILPSGFVSKLAGKQVNKSVGDSDDGSSQKTAGIYGLVGTLEKKGALKDVAINLLDNMYDN